MPNRPPDDDELHDNGADIGPSFGPSKSVSVLESALSDLVSAARSWRLCGLVMCICSADETVAQ
jgi:hypothetical protein